MEEKIRVWPFIFGLKKPELFKGQNKFKSWSQRNLETSLLLGNFGNNIISLSFPIFFGINQTAADIILLQAIFFNWNILNELEPKTIVFRLNFSKFKNPLKHIEKIFPKILLYCQTHDDTLKITCIWYLEVEQI